MIISPCSRCGANLQAEVSQAGEQLLCPPCGQGLEVPLRVPTPAAVPAPASGWYYLRDQERIGPMSEQAMEQLARQGVIREDDLVWGPGLEGWCRASRCFSFYRPREEEAEAPLVRRYRPTPESERAAQVCGVLACIFGGVALLCFPLIFGLPGLVPGIISVCPGRHKRLGLAGIVVSVVCVSVVCAIVGLVIGVPMWTGR